MNDDLTNTGIAERPAEKETASSSSSSLSPSSHAASRNGNEKRAVLERKPQGPPKTIWREYFESAVVTVIMALFGMTFIVQAVKVPTGSMQNTITIGDHLLVNKFIFAPGPPLPFLPQREIQRGDIIVFKYPGNSNQKLSEQIGDPENIPFKTNYVKRVIGLPGEHVEIRDDRVYINGKMLPEHRITAVDHDDNPATIGRLENNAPLEIRENPPRAADEPYSVFYSINRSFDSDKKFDVPADSYFVMGDNRNNSSDSRVWGYVKREYVVGRAMFVYWSYDESAPSTNPLSSFFTNTRWNRTGTMVK
ncbi:MAG TPA: signal peptidase I [Pyrinomonadaceae bacterium]|nr:signal peptidase I [Pyrinomonadaceae bacterium]